ncbi:hypothetical protein TWF730_006613 [Orbilia blumenaviensis]|uniref:Uncharacterized protein n=1 Tax=Orbilia blumenaviensis TaxID=1796055 RepID=A0AAV9VHS3_9PEZI
MHPSNSTVGPSGNLYIHETTYVGTPIWQSVAFDLFKDIRSLAWKPRWVFFETTKWPILLSRTSILG